MEKTSSEKFKEGMLNYLEKTEGGAWDMYNRNSHFKNAVESLTRSYDRERDALKVILLLAKIIEKQQRLFNCAVGWMDMKGHSELTKLQEKIEREAYTAKT